VSTILQVALPMQARDYSRQRWVYISLGVRFACIRLQAKSTPGRHCSGPSAAGVCIEASNIFEPNCETVILADDLVEGVLNSLPRFLS
jgi:hypothetical protein